jgi:alpha-glucosidase (family GH31 glycosyl hydrolase)
MDNFADFSVNDTTFPKLAEYTKNIQEQNKQKMIVIVDGGLSADDETNKYFRQAKDNNLLMLSNHLTPG